MKLSDRVFDEFFDFFAFNHIFAGRNRFLKVMAVEKWCLGLQAWFTRTNDLVLTQDIKFSFNTRIDFELDCHIHSN